MGKLRVTVLLGVLVVLFGITNGLPTEVPILRPESYTTTIMEELEDTVIVEAESEDSTTNEPETNESESGSSGLKEFDPSDCFLPKSKGPCRAVIDSWYFNTVTKSCEQFLWSGCGGNANRFREQAHCEAHCSNPAVPATEVQVSNNSSTSTSTSTETIPPLPSTSTSTSFPVITHKHKLPNCPKFDGCSNKCVIIQDRSDRGCKKCLCGSSTEDKDQVPPTIQVSSSNNVTIQRETGEVSISVGSVSGLPKDAELEEDAPTPGNAADNCRLPTRRGNCRGMMTRYRYDPALKDCFEFHYGGCDGNLNNFVTKAKCLEYCKGQ